MTVTNEQFLQRAFNKHGNKYEYLSPYVGYFIKIKIKCPDHDIFEQLPADHLKGFGCALCAGKGTMSNELFLKRAREAHGDKYKYLSTYINGNTPVDIECSEHGPFKQKSHNHIELKQGCPLCGYTEASNKRKTGLDAFIIKATEVHGGKYTYIGPYINTDTLIKIICPKHYIFEQTPHSHLNGRGCMDCANEARSISYRKNINVFISQAKKAHGEKYDYSEVVYINTHTKVKINCPDHEPFWQSPSHHIKGHGCPQCGKGANTSKAETAWLDYINVPKEWRGNRANFRIGKQLIKPDAHDRITNTIYEFYGDYWHANLAVHDADDFNKDKQMKFGDIYRTTMEREQLLKDNGYKIISIWESDWKKLVKLAKVNNK